MTPAYDHLKNGQQQADEEGVMVTVSRQAVDEVLSEYAELEAENAKLKERAKAIVNRVAQLKRMGGKLPNILLSSVNALAAALEGEQDE